MIRLAKTQYTIRMEDVYLEKAKFIADKEIRSLNNLIEYFVAHSIEEYEKQNGTIELPSE